MKIIGICGKKQSGKDSFAGFVQELLPDRKVKRLSLAKPLKDFVHATFDVPKQNIWGSDNDKNFPLCTWGEIFTEDALEAYGLQPIALLSAREILQVVGTDVMRLGKYNYLQQEYRLKCIEFNIHNFGQEWVDKNDMSNPNIWIELLLMDIKLYQARGEADIVTIPDIRFKNELAAFKNAGAILVRLYRDAGTHDSIPHPSELEMEEIEDGEFKYVIYEHENKSLKQLKAETIKILMQEKIIPMFG